MPGLRECPFCYRDVRGRLASVARDVAQAMTSESSGGWVGVDLDGTLAHYDKWVSEDHIGEPIPAMVARVKAWLAEGIEVRIMTARASPVTKVGRDVERSVRLIGDWCEQHLGQRLAVTCAKDYAMIELWDDRCVQVVPNTGMPVAELIR